MGEDEDHSLVDDMRLKLLIKTCNLAVRQRYSIVMFNCCKGTDLAFVDCAFPKWLQAKSLVTLGCMHILLIISKSSSSTSSSTSSSSSSTTTTTAPSASGSFSNLAFQTLQKRITELEKRGFPVVVSRSHGPRKESIQAPCFVVAVFKPIQSMYGIFTYIWLAVMVNVGKCTIHAWYGFFLLQNLLISAVVFLAGAFACCR